MAVLKEDLLQIGQLVKHLRKQQSQKDLAQATGTTIPLISNIENGKRAIPKRKLVRFAQVLGVDQNALSPRSVTAASLQKDLKEMGLAFRGLKDLPIEAKDELVGYYLKLKERYLEGESIVKKSIPD